MLMLILKIGNISQLSSSTPLHHITPGNLGEMIRGWIEGYLKVREDFTITEKAPTSTFSWLKAATSAFTFKTLLRHYAKQTLTHGK